MSENNLKHRLMPMDAFFLFAETETAPMTVGATLIFDGKLPFAKFKEHMAARLHLVPRYRQRVIPAPLNIDYPTWEDDPDFDIDNHMFRVVLDKPGGEKQLQQLKGRIFTGMLDRNKPLWEMYLVEGLSGGRSALIMRVHHCMVDGVAGISLAYLFLDPSADPPPRMKKPAYNPRPLPGLTKRLANSLWDKTFDNVSHWLRFTGNVKEFTGKFDRVALRHAMRDFAATMGNFLLPFARMPFNRPFSGGRRFAWRNYSDADTRAIRTMCGGTLNDVALTALGAAMRQYAKDDPRCVWTKHRSLRVLVPVNVRRDHEQASMGNRISFLPVEIPLTIEDPIELLHAVHEQMRNLKESRVADAVSLMFDALQGLPVAVQATLLGSVASPKVQRLLGQAIDIPPANIICTNVPGPQMPLYALGRKLLEMYAVVPTVLGMGVNCTVVSYNQKIFITFMGDKGASGDAVSKVMDCFDAKFNELHAAAELKSAKYIELKRAVQQHVHEFVPPKNAPGPAISVPTSAAAKQKREPRSRDRIAPDNIPRKQVLQ